MCRYFEVSRNSYYYWLSRKEITKADSRKQILDKKIQTIFNKSKQVYGSPRICVALNKQGVKISRSYVARLMKASGYKSVLRKKFVNTTDSKHEYTVHSNILNRDFNAKELGSKWVSDITYIRCNNKWVYLTTMIDLADRKVVGWSLSKDMTTENTVIKAWNAARCARDITKGFILHSDRGVQYASGKFTSILANNKRVSQSMSRKGNCWDNSVAESFFKSIKYEMVYRYSFLKFEILYKAIEEYIRWYNYERIHSSLGYKTPFEMEMELTKIIKYAA